MFCKGMVINMANINMSTEKNPMPVQDPQVRNHNFQEVALGYSEETAINEALRCLNCKNMPCVAGCPVKIHIPLPCRQYADVYVPRKRSARACACAVKRENQLELAVWSVL